MGVLFFIQFFLFVIIQFDSYYIVEKLINRSIYMKGLKDFKKEWVNSQSDNRTP